MGVLVYIPILLLGLTSLIDKSTQVARPQATLFSKPANPFSHRDPYSYRVPSIVRYTAPEGIFGPYFADAPPKDEPADPKSAYQAYLQSRLQSRLNPIRMSLPREDPDVTLVEWLLNNTQRKAETANDQFEQGSDASDSRIASPDSSFRRDGLGDLLRFNPVTRERLKRNDDGRGIAFHQCYWNPVSCFR